MDKVVIFYKNKKYSVAESKVMNATHVILPNGVILKIIAFLESLPAQLAYTEVDSIIDDAISVNAQEEEGD